MKVYWFGMGGHASMAEALRPMIRDLGMELVTIHEHNADIKWDRFTYVSELREADIIVLPANFEKWPAKSCNKLTQALSLGKPVVCSPQDSYLAVLEKYPDSFMVAKNDEEWKSCLTKLRDSSNVRQEMSVKAIEAAKDFFPDAIGQKWLSALGPADRVDIVIPTYNNLPCLKLCLDSIRACTQVLYNIIVVNNGPDEDVHKYLEKQADVVYIKKDRLKFAQAVNIGIKAGTSKHVMVLNDDTIVSKGWLSNMLELCREHPEVGAVGPLSNCDKGWRHNYDFNMGGVNLLPGQNTIEEIEPVLSLIHSFKSPWNEVVERDWLALYCTLIPRSVVEKIGILDEKFTNSGEDIDYCNRIRKMGYKCVSLHDSFVFHFGAVGRKILEKEDPDSYQAADRATQAYLREKWGQQNVVIYTGPAWERWDFRNVDNGGIAGSETWATELARAFSRLGYRVKIFADCPEQGIMDGDIEYLHYGSWGDYIEQNWIDYFISSRTTDTLRFPVRAGKVYVMIHDVWLLSERTQLFLDKVDKFCVLSEWHRDFVKGYHGIPDDKLWVTSNGLDFGRFEINGIEREPYRLVYSSSPDRGLDTLLYLFDFMRAEVPELELHIYYGFDNWEKSILLKDDQEQKKKAEEIRAAMKKAGVFYHGRVGQKELAKEFLKSSLWAYPSDFEESFCCHPDVEVITSKGRKKIKKVVKNDKVLTHAGRFKRVQKVMLREASELIRLWPKNLLLMKGLTPEHPVLTVKKENLRCKRLYHTLCTKRGRKCQVGHCYYSKRGKKYFSKNTCERLTDSYQVEWLPCSEIRKDDFVVFPRNRNKNEPKNLSCYFSSDTTDDGYIFNPKTRATKIRDFKLTPEFMGMCGWYVSEGSYDPRGGLVFSLNIDEQGYADEISQVLFDIGIPFRVIKKRITNTMMVICHSVILGRFLVRHFGSGAHDKHVPSWVKSLKRKYLVPFLRGILLGDGCQDRNTEVYESASKNLVEDIFEILVKFGCVSSLSRTFKKGLKVRKSASGFVTIKPDPSKRFPAYRLVCSMSQNVNLFNEVGLNPEHRDNPTGFGHLMDDNFVYLSVKRISKDQYKGFVYNLEVEDDNSYIVDNISVHNCITALEIQRAQVPVVASNYAGLRTTVGDSGILIGNGNKGESYTKQYREEFVAKCLEVIQDNTMWTHWSERGFANTEKYSWDNVAKQWQKMFEGG